MEPHEGAQSPASPPSPAPGASATGADNQAWACVDGTPMRLLSLERKPDVLCCNAYVLDAPSFLLVVDPGADDEQTVRLGAILAGLRNTRPRAILALLTHAHRDHALALAGLSEAAGAPVTLMAHTAGADALGAGDAHFTHSDLTGKTFPRIPVTFRLFADGMAGGNPRAGTASSPAAPGGAVPGGAAEAVGRVPDSSPAAAATGPLPGSTSELSSSTGPSPLLRQRLTFSSAEVLDIYHTPGHSPDSISLHVGDQVFVGDVLSAAAPGVAGKVGWDQEALRRSLIGLADLIEADGIATCRPGHGWAVPGGKAVPALRGAGDRVAGMTNLALLDRKRAQFLGRYARVLLRRALVVFSIIAGKLLSLSYWLEQLEEPGEAERIQGLLDLDSVDAFFADFQAFVDDFVEGTAATAVPLKGVQVVKRIEKVFQEEGLQGVLNPQLLRTFRNLMTDYVNAVQGFRFEDYGRPENLNDIVHEMVTLLDRPAVTADDYFAAADDSGDFLRRLTQQLAYRPLFEAIDVRLEPAPNLPLVSIDRDRLMDVLLGLVEQLAALKADSITLETFAHADHVRLAVTTGAPLPSPGLARDQLDYYRLTLQLYGGEFRVAGDPAPSTLLFEFPAHEGRQPAG